jgi:general secretion pathway protein E
MQLSVLAATVQSGGYISPVKVGVVALLMLIWIKLLAWADKDAEAAHLPRENLNTANAVGLIVAMVLFFWLPSFWIAFPVLFLIFAAEVGTYLGIRHKKVGLTDLKKDFHEWLNSFGRKKKEAAAAAGELQFIDSHKKNLPSPDAEAPERAGYDGLQRLLTDPLKKGLDRLEMTPAEGAATVSYWVDGVMYSGGSIERTESAETIRYAKAAAGLDVNDRRKPQSGMMKVGLNGQVSDLRISSAGSASGESLRVQVNPKQRHAIKLDDLGFSDGQLEKVKASVSERKGVVLVGAPKEQGLTSMLYALIRAHDVFLQHIHTIERDPEDDLEGITQNKLPKMASRADESKLAAWVLDQEPDVVMISEIHDPATAKLLAQWAGEGKRVYVGLRTGSTFDAVNQWRKLVGNDQAAMGSLEMAVTGRVARKLCMACKMGYHPDATTLKKLNMDPSKVTQLYQARNQPLRDPKGNPIPCEFCHDLRYKGRTGLFELLVVTDEVRAAVLAGETGALKSAFRKQKGRYLQEEALAKVEAGETSVNEVLRALRSGTAAPPAGASATTRRAAAPAPAPAPATGAKAKT